MAPENAWADVRALLAWDPQPVDRDLLLQAHDIEHRHDLCWRDSMIVAAAQLRNCALLLTEDRQDWPELRRRDRLQSIRRERTRTLRHNARAGIATPAARVKRKQISHCSSRRPRVPHSTN